MSSFEWAYLTGINYLLSVEFLYLNGDVMDLRLLVWIRELLAGRYPLEQLSA